MTGSRALSAADRQRAKRARDRAAREAERIEAEAAPLRLVLAAQAEQDLATIEAHLEDGQRGLAMAERTLEGVNTFACTCRGGNEETSGGLCWRPAEASRAP